MIFFYDFDFRTFFAWRPHPHIKLMWSVAVPRVLKIGATDQDITIKCTFIVELEVMVRGSVSTQKNKVFQNFSKLLYIGVGTYLRLGGPNNTCARTF